MSKLSLSSEAVPQIVRLTAVILVLLHDPLALDAFGEFLRPHGVIVLQLASLLQNYLQYSCSIKVDHRVQSRKKRRKILPTAIVTA